MADAGRDAAARDLGVVERDAAVDASDAAAADRAIDVGAPDLGVEDTGLPDAVIAGDSGAVADAGCVHPIVVQSCGAERCTIPAGCFVMGSPLSEPCRESYQNKETPHQVRLTRSFEITRTKVTQDRFRARMGYTPPYNNQVCGDCPVLGASTDEAAAYCNALSALEQLASCYTCTGSGETIRCTAAPEGLASCRGFRLPTEAEWEYAYRAGTTTAFYTGPNAAGACFGGSDPNADSIAWYFATSNGMLHPVGQKAPNAWGLFDMAGDSYEWVEDDLERDLGSAPAVDPLIKRAGAERVLRSGPFTNHAYHMRAAVRESFPAGQHVSNVSFRCVRSL